MKKKFLKGMVACLLAVTVTSCGAQFNTVGAKMGNMNNGAQVTSQDSVTYFIEDGDLYKKDKGIETEARLVEEGDFINVNVVGDKVFYYDNAISTICRSNSEGDRVHRIAEVYTDKFVVCKDNVIAQILIGQGNDDLENPDNYSIATMKVTEGKVTSTMPTIIIEKAKLVGAVGDYIYTEKNVDGKLSLVKYDLKGENETVILPLNKDSQVMNTAEGFVVLGTVDGKYGLHSYGLDGKYGKLITKVGKKPGGNVANINGDTIYFEDYSVKKLKKKKIVRDNLVKISLDGTDETVLVKKKVPMNYSIGVGSNGTMYTAVEESDLDAVKQWKTLEVEK